MDTTPSAESARIRLLRSLHLLFPLCQLLAVYSTSFADFISKFKQLESVRKFSIFLSLLPTLELAQAIGVAEAVSIITDWSSALKYTIL